MATRARKTQASPLPAVAPVDPVVLITSKLGERIDAIFATLEKADRDAQASLSTEVNGAVKDLMFLGKVAGEISGIIDPVFIEHRPKSARQYSSGLKFALAWGLQWTPNLHSLEGQVAAMVAAGKADKMSPKHKAKLAEVQDAKDAKATAKSGARSGKPKVNDNAATLKLLAEALANTRARGDNEWALDILDAIHSKFPEFKEPTGE